MKNKIKKHLAISALLFVGLVLCFALFATSSQEDSEGADTCNSKTDVVQVYDIYVGEEQFTLMCTYPNRSPRPLQGRNLFCRNV